MADISKLIVGSKTYNIKDATARQNPTKFLGKTTTPITDGSTDPLFYPEGSYTQVSATKGDIVYRTDVLNPNVSFEYIWDGSKWREFGAGSKLQSLAFKSEASGSYTPQGTIGSLSFIGKNTTFEGSYTPSGTVGQPNFTGEEVDITNGRCTPSGTVSTPTITVAAATSAMEILPKCSVDTTTETLKLDAVTLSATSSPLTFSGSPSTVTGKVTAKGTCSSPSFFGMSKEVKVSGIPEGQCTGGIFTGTPATITVS